MKTNTVYRLASAASSLWEDGRRAYASYVDYYPFGYPMATRTWQQENYRYGFTGQEKDDEIYGSGNSTTAEFWQYDTRLGRRWNLEPLASKYPFISPYATFSTANPAEKAKKEG